MLDNLIVDEFSDFQMVWFQYELGFFFHYQTFYGNFGGERGNLTAQYPGFESLPAFRTVQLVALFQVPSTGQLCRPSTSIILGIVE